MEIFDSSYYIINKRLRFEAEKPLSSGDHNHHLLALDTVGKFGCDRKITKNPSS